MYGKTAKNALCLLLEKRQTTVKDLFKKQIMLMGNGSPITLDALERIVSSQTMRISEENFERIDLEYVLTEEEKKGLKKMILSPRRFYKGASTKDLNVVIHKDTEKKLIRL